MFSPKREEAKGGRSLGTMRPPAVTRIPGGLPCSLRSFSAFPRLIEGDGEGLFCSVAAAVEIADTAGSRRLLVDSLLVRFAAADAEGRKTCSESRNMSAFVNPVGQTGVKAKLGPLPGGKHEGQIERDLNSTQFVVGNGKK